MSDTLENVRVQCARCGLWWTMKFEAWLSALTPNGGINCPRCRSEDAKKRSA